jgi:dTDP-4-amino-4,6-dideoxygalactose transaminase
MSAIENIMFTRPNLAGEEVDYIRQVLEGTHLSGDGAFTHRCHEWLERETGAKRALLTHSCTAALEMAALLFDLAPGDEVIMPSFTFVSTANAVVLRGGIPVFIDIRADTLNLDETLLEQAITPRTKAIIPVHYAGVGCEMDAIMAMALRHNLRVAEDAAQGLMASYRGRPLGTIGDVGTLSFHETKNIVSGEGGALLVNDADLAHRAEILREKGTDRSRFLRGEVDKYTWQDIGSSFLPSEILAAFLAAQLDQAQAITARRLAMWNRYHEALADAEKAERLRRPVVPADCTHNGHIYHVVLPDNARRDEAMEALRDVGIRSTFHYVPLHDAPAGLRYARVAGKMTVTNDLPRRLLRLPLHGSLTDDDQDRVVQTLCKVLCR